MTITLHDIKATCRFGHRYLINRLVDRYPPPVQYSGPTSSRDIEVHILTSQHDWAMTCWTLASYYAMSQRADAAVLHDDGTLGHDVVEYVDQLFPNARVISRSESDPIIYDEFRKYPRLLELRKRLPHIMKLLDFRLFCRSSRLIMVDSDVLFLANPKELYETNGSHRFSRDRETTYAIESEKLKKRTNINLPPQINCGIGNVSKEGVDLEAMEWLLNTGLIDLERCLPNIDQTLWAVECGRKGFEYLPASYRVCDGPGLGNLVAKHYVGLVLDRFRTSRDYFFVEGIPMVRRLLQGQVRKVNAGTM
jgi:hypothetical protein